jgi:hypothetical protein
MTVLGQPDRSSSSFNPGCTNRPGDVQRPGSPKAASALVHDLFHEQKHF